MKTLTRTLPLIAALLGPALAAPAPYTASGGTTNFQHTVGFVPVRGTIAGVSAAVQLDVGDLAATKGSVTVPVKNLQTGIKLRDDHAKGQSALHTAQHPNATFQLTNLTGGKLQQGQTLATTATGQLTVKGVTKRAQVPIKATLQGDKVNIRTQFKFNPHDFGVSYKGSSDSVTVDVQFMLSPR